MRRPSLRACLALGLVTMFAVVGCATTIGGAGVPATPGGTTATTSDSSTSTSRTSASSGSSSGSSGSTGSSATSESTTSSSSSGGSRTSTTTTTGSSSSRSTTVEIPTDLPTELPTDFPTDLPTDFPTFGTELPADWPAELQLPPGSDIYSATSDSGEYAATFEVKGTANDIAAFFAGELTAAGYTESSKMNEDGFFYATYEKSGTTVEVTMIEYSGDVIGSVTARTQ